MMSRRPAASWSPRKVPLVHCQPDTLIASFSVVLKRCMKLKPSTEVLDSSSMQAAVGQLGCSKCRYSKNGCARCRNPEFKHRTAATIKPNTSRKRVRSPSQTVRKRSKSARSISTTAGVVDRLQQLLHNSAKQPAVCQGADEEHSPDVPLTHSVRKAAQTLMRLSEERDKVPPAEPLEAPVGTAKPDSLLTTRPTQQQAGTEQLEVDDEGETLANLTTDYQPPTALGPATATPTQPEAIVRSHLSEQATAQKHFLAKLKAQQAAVATHKQGKAKKGGATIKPSAARTPPPPSARSSAVSSPSSYHSTDCNVATAVPQVNSTAAAANTRDNVPRIEVAEQGVPQGRASTLQAVPAAVTTANQSLQMFTDQNAAVPAHTSTSTHITSSADLAAKVHEQHAADAVLDTAAGSGALAVNPRVTLWTPPQSPYSLLEEVLYANPWKLLLACMLLNKTSGKQVRKVIERLFEVCPNPEAALDADTQAIQDIIQPLGLFRKRAVAIKRFSEDYINKNWQDPRELYGIGKYAADAYYMFCRGNWREVAPDDKDLKKYHAWLVLTDGQGEGLERDTRFIKND